jgi:signal transduction histidine kinase
MIAPLRIQSQVFGYIAITRDRPGNPYTREDQVLLQSIADRAAVTIENCRLFRSINEQKERLRALSTRLLEAREAERHSVARELHDEIGQLLTGLDISLKMASRLPPEKAQENLSEAKKLIQQLLDRVQSLSLDLRPAALDDLGLVPALAMQMERYTYQTGVQVRFDHRGVSRRFPSTIETAAYRIVQEGLTNVARHAHTKEATVRVWAEGSTLGIQIDDKGCGFDVPSALATHASSGLSGMQEEAELIGGQLTIESTPGSGTLITVELPLDGVEKGGQDEHDDPLPGR